MTIEVRLYIDVDGTDKDYNQVRTIVGDVVNAAMEECTKQQVHARHFDTIVIETMQALDFDEQ